MVGDQRLNMSLACRSSSQLRFLPNCHLTPASIFHRLERSAMPCIDGDMYEKSTDSDRGELWLNLNELFNAP